MTLLRGIVAGLSMLAAHATAAPVPKPTSGGPPSLVYPTKVGDTRRYECETVVVTAVEQNDGATLVTTVTTINVAPNIVVRPGVPRTYVHKVAVSAEGVFMLEGEGKRLDPPPCVVKLPVVPGGRWTGSLGHQLVARKPEQVRVPAGTFTAIPIEYVEIRPLTGEKVLHIDWHTPGLGRVRAVSIDGGREFVRDELLEFTPGKP